MFPSTSSRCCSRSRTEPDSGRPATRCLGQDRLRFLAGWPRASAPHPRAVLDDRAAERGFFARRFVVTGRFPDPAVFRVTVPDADMLAYLDDRHEQEWIVVLPQSVRPVRVRNFDLDADAQAWVASIQSLGTVTTGR
jgi:hypothetical protein